MSKPPTPLTVGDLVALARALDKINTAFPSKNVNQIREKLKEISGPDVLKVTTALKQIDKISRKIQKLPVSME